MTKPRAAISVTSAVADPGRISGGAPAAAHRGSAPRRAAPCAARARPPPAPGHRAPCWPDQPGAPGPPMSRGQTAIMVLYYPATRGAAALAHRFVAAVPHIADAQASAVSLEDTVPAELHEATLALVVRGDGSILGTARLCSVAARGPGGPRIGAPPGGGHCPGRDGARTDHGSSRGVCGSHGHRHDHTGGRAGGAGRERGAALRATHRCWDSRGARGELAAVGKTPMYVRIAEWGPKDSGLAVVDEARAGL